MGSVFNKGEVNVRKSLRQNMPKPEHVLWQKLRNSQVNGYKFRRQQSILNYIFDFYCPNKKLVIEIDGDSHYSPESKRKDEIRDQELNKFNIRILRFTNNEVMKNLEGVLQVIQIYLCKDE